MFKKRSKLSRDGTVSRRKNKENTDTVKRKQDFDYSECEDSEDESMFNTIIIKKRSRIGEQSVEVTEKPGGENTLTSSGTKQKVNGDSKEETDGLSSNVEKNNDINSGNIEEVAQERETIRTQFNDKKQSQNDIMTSFVMRGKSDKLTKQITQASNLKTTILMDYQPDICKDFKQTGYCGYGDSCKFLHSRDDFKAGWKLNQDWKISAEEDEGKRTKLDLADVPFKCVLCKMDYRSPVVTNCGHYFCSSCFFKRIKTDTKCSICGKDTLGSAKIATNLKSILRRKQSNYDD